jgi:hypothetical protein
MKKLFLALLVLGLVIGTSLTALAHEDRQVTTGMMNIGIIIITATGTVSEASGVIAITSMNSSESARNWAAFEPELRTRESLSIRNIG